MPDRPISGRTDTARRRSVPVLAGAMALGLLAGPAAIAQIDGGQRGVAPVNSDASYEVHGIEVDERGKSGQDARDAAWKVAMRAGWEKLWSKEHGSGAPKLSDGQLFGIVSGVIVEDEQVGPTRYVARLGVMFDRARAGQILGVAGSRRRSAPLLVIPVFWDGAVPMSYEGRNEWQKAWARFNTADSPIDYVRLTGVGADPLLANAMQAGRGDRRWWRVVLDSYGAADVIQPEVRLTRAWPGGPVSGTFVAREGPDGRVLESFQLTAGSVDILPAMLDRGVRRLDEAYVRALAAGTLRPDPTLIIETPAEELAPADQTVVSPDDPPAGETQLEVSDRPLLDRDVEPPPSTAPASAPPSNAVQSFTVQIATPDAAAVTSAEASLRGTPGVQGASTTSTAVGGTSVVRVSFAGDLETLAGALRARGWQVTAGSGALRISR